ncbi:MAG: hypothetical protein JWM41_2179 [Gemmatimonadetes bacterium]|nr:hypothetical protein [Gemmatimonadota bacterium]
MDHVIPISRGGSHTRENVVPACRSCNSKKGDLMLLEWVFLNAGALARSGKGVRRQLRVA